MEISASIARKGACNQHPPAPARRRPAAAQAGSKPPTFVLFVNDPDLFPEDYRKYIERQLRENIGFPGTPLRLYWRGKQGGWGKGVEPR